MIKTTPFKKNGEPLEWLVDAVHYLATFNFTNNEKLRILRRYITSKIKTWNRQLENDY